MTSTTDKSKVSVAIVTARRDEDTTYEEWRSLRKAFLAGASSWGELDLQGPSRKVLTGEFGGLLMACLGSPARHHVEYQLRALALQTTPPDEVLIVSRRKVPPELCDGWPFPVNISEPLLSEAELRLVPNAAVSLLFEDELRCTEHSFGCADKNTAVVLARSPNLVMLDDCCLPGPGLVEAVHDTVCKDGCILMLRHRQLYRTLEVADANEDLAVGHVVFGIFASPVKYLLDVNGWNQALDGQRSGLDAELKLRMDRYTRMREVSYVTHPAARVYEIEHSYPWGSAPGEWEEATGYKAPGPDLAALREAAQAILQKEDDDARAEEEEEEDFDDE